MESEYLFGDGFPMTTEDVIDVRDDVPPEVMPVDMEAFKLRPFVPNEGGTGFFEMRPYQDEAVTQVYEDWQHHHGTMIVMATGCGKTICFSEVALRWPIEMGRVLVVAHREELIDQAAEKIGVHLQESVSIEMGDRRELRGGLIDSYTKVVVASIQTLIRPKRRAHYKPKEIGCLIIDEHHHSASKSYRDVVKHFIALNPQLRILGVTATPERGDNKSLADITPSCSYEMSLPIAIDQGWLVDVEQRLIVVEGLDFSAARTTGGDLNQKDLANLMLPGSVKSVIEVDDDDEQYFYDDDSPLAGDPTAPLTDLQKEDIAQQEKMLHAVVLPTLKEAEGKPTIVFCVTKKHAERMCEIFNRYKPYSAQFITDETPRDRRKEIIVMFKSGQLQFLVGVGVFLEGFDAPNAEVIVMARPTKSKSVYVQAIGRGTRPLPRVVDPWPTALERIEAISFSAKPKCIVLDFVGNSGRHQLMSAIDVLGGECDQDIIDEVRKKILAGETGTIKELISKTRVEIEEAKKKAAAEKAERDRQAAERAEQDRIRRELEAKRRAEVKATTQYRTEIVGQGVKIPEQIGAGMFRGGSTDNQVKFLIRLGVSHEEACKYSTRQAAVVIDKLTSQTGGDFIVTFGKHAGRKLKDIPSGYLDWALGNMNDQRVVQNIHLFRNGASNVETPF